MTITPGQIAFNDGQYLAFSLSRPVPWGVISEILIQHALPGLAHMGVLLGLLGVLLVLTLLAVILVLPIVAYVRTRTLDVRLRRLEQEVRDLAGIDLKGTTQIVSPPVTPVKIQREAEPIPAAKAPRPPKPAPAPAFKWLEARGLEDFLGRRALGWVAVVLLLFAAGFFLAYAFENQWVGPQGQASIGLIAGVALCGAGYRQHRSLPLFSQMLTAGGVVLLYLSTFASFGFFRPPLMSVEHGGIFLVLIVAETFGLALAYRSTGIAIMAVIGGLLAPLLLSTGVDRYVSLFLYLLTLNAGVVGLNLIRRFPFTATLSLAGTQLLFWGWFNEYYHPEKLPAAFLFQTVLFLLYLGHALVRHVVRGVRAGLEDIVRQPALAGLLAAALYALLREDWRPWLGAGSLVLAIVYTALTWLTLRRREQDAPLQLVFLATALAFVAIVFPLETSTVWSAVGWAVEGLALWWFGLRIRNDVLRGMGVAFLGAGVLRWLLEPKPWWRQEWFVPFFNSYFLPALAVTICVLVAAEASRRFLRPLSPASRVVQAVLGLGGVLLGWFILSREVYDIFFVWESRSAEMPFGAIDRFLLAQTALSALWALYAILVLVIGLRIGSEPLRWTGLGLFGLTLAKVVLYDTASLRGLYRVLVFVALAVMMAAAARGYQKLVLRPAAQKGANDDRS